MVREVSRSAAVLVAVAALAVLASPGPARGQGLQQLYNEFQAEQSAGRFREAERKARQALAIATLAQNQEEIAACL